MFLFQKIRNESPSKFGQTNPPQKNKCSCQEDKNRPDCSAGSEVKEQVKDFPDFDEDVFGKILSYRDVSNIRRTLVGN